MERKRILELALESLEKQRAEIERAIAEIREFGDGQKRVFDRNPKTPALVVAKRRSKTKAERMAHSLRMKRYWAARKARQAKPAAATKARRRTEAQKNAISLKLKEAWKRRKAAAAAKPDTKTVKAAE